MKNSTNLILIDDIKDGYLIVWDTIVWIIGLDWIDFELMNAYEKERVLRNFVRFLATIPTPIQIYLSTMKLDIKKYMEIYQMRVNSLSNLTDKQKQIMIQGMGSLLSSTVQNNSILEKRFYILVNMNKGSTPIENVFLPEYETLSKKEFSDAEWQALKSVAEDVIEDMGSYLASMWLWPRRVWKEEITELFRNEFRNINQTIEDSPSEYVNW